MVSSKLTKASLYAILTGVFVGALLIANIIAGRVFAIGSITLPTAVIIFPIVYIVNDVLAEVYGFQKARRVILIGFAINLLAVIAYSIALLLPAPVWFEHSAAYVTVLGTTFRILFASFIAYLIGTTLNSKVMVSMRRGRESGSKGLFARAITSTLVGESVDAIIFITLVFAFLIPFKDLVIMIVAQAIIKTVYEIIVFPVTQKVINYVIKLPEGQL